MKYFVLLVTLFFLSGCNDSNNHSRPYMAGSHLDPNNRVNSSTKVVTAKIDSAKEQEIAKITMQKEIETQRLKNEAIMREAQLNKEMNVHSAILNKDVALAKNETEKVMQKENSKMQTWWLIAIVLLILVILIFIYSTVQKSRKDKLIIHHEKLEHELHLKEQETKLKMAEKVLDALSSGNLSEKNEEMLISSLNYKDEPKKLK